MLILRKPWDSQPPAGTPLDVDNPSNDRVCFAWSPAQPTAPLVGLGLTPTNAAFAANTDGVVSRLTAGYWGRANYAPVVTSNGAGTGDFTSVVRANPTASASVQCLLAQRRGSGSFEQFGIIANSTGGGSPSAGAIEYFTFSGTLIGATHAGRIDGRFHTWAIRRVGSVVSFWEDGVQLGSSSGTIQTISHSTSDYVIGANTAAGVFPSTCDFSFQWSSNRGLTDGELADAARDYRTLFEPRLIWVPVSAAAGGITGTLATTNASDTSAASGTTTIVGTLAKTNANDTSAASGTTTVLGTLARTNANDTSSASGTTTVLGASAATNADDTSAASGTVGTSGTTGTVAVTNANDTAAASGTTTVVGTVARANADDPVSASGWVGAITGTLAYTNADDTLSASGTAAGPAQAAPVGGGGYLPSFRRKTRKEIHAERVRLGILPEQIRKAAKKVVEKAAEQGDPQEVYEDNTEKYKQMFLREVGATKWAPDYARAIRIQLELMERDAEDALLLM